MKREKIGEDIPCCGPFDGGANICTDRRRLCVPAHRRGGTSGSTIHRVIGRTICGTGKGGEICIEHGETAFLVDDLRNFLTTGGRRLPANAARSALDASRKKT